MLAKNPRAPRLSRQHASSLTIFASKLAPTGGRGFSFITARPGLPVPGRGSGSCPAHRRSR
ncbi:hypothetical protein C1Y30_20245 [Pseudomonas sp. GW704-F3]|nr:hypothetical protein C1Y30_20245 [Pseudomonas sp. GW704-F3]PMU94569.1 hypothetical protein C1Y28_16035 [Pseudomonas sp. GW704-F5]PMV02814.1 hypothetical protein C1Y29_15995 [Pseudomonas sp. MPBD4-3]PMV21576.1 hypothetical protein C1Y27_27380 [Pseudomonas sp. GW704-F2]